MMSRSASTAVLVAIAAATAQGGTVTSYFGQDFGTPPNTAPAVLTNTRAAQTSFLSRLTGNSTQSFEGIAAGTNGPFNLTFTGSAGNLGATTSGNVAVQNNAFGIGQIYGTQGTQFLFASSSIAGGGFTLDFAQETAAFGFTATDVGDFGVQIALKLTNGATQNINIPYVAGSGGSTNANALYFGVVAEDFTFDKVEFIITSGGTFDSFGFDEMTIGDREQVSVIPLPHAAGMAIAGLGVLGLRRRRTASIA